MAGTRTRLTAAEIEQRRSEYQASFDAQRRAARDPQFMALLRKKLAELERKKAQG